MKEDEGKDKRESDKERGEREKVIVSNRTDGRLLAREKGKQTVGNFLSQ